MIERIQIKINKKALHNNNSLQKYQEANHHHYN